MKMTQSGSVYVNNGLWYYAVKLPGEPKRRMIPLKAPGSDRTLTADRPYAMARAAAARWWEAQTRGAAGRVGNLLETVAAAYVDHAATYYRHPDGSPTSEAACVRLGVRLLREMYGSASVAELTHADMVKWRDACERSGIARKTVNERIGVAKRMWTWALDVGLISATERAELSQLSPLKRGRSLARETVPVRAVDDATIEKTLAVMVANTADMVRVHRLTGMRPDEMCGLRWSLIDQSQLPWVYRPSHHKNDWRGEEGQPRAVCIGPKAREILERHRTAGDVPFSPRAALGEWLEAKREAAVSPSRQDRRNPSHPRILGEQWDTSGYSRTIRYACGRAALPVWSANQLRHSFATEVRRKFGLEACRAVLGHALGGGCVTDRYSFEALEDEMIAKAAPAVEALG